MVRKMRTIFAFMSFVFFALPCILNTIKLSLFTTKPYIMFLNNNAKELKAKEEELLKLKDEYSKY